MHDGTKNGNQLKGRGVKEKSNDSSQPHRQPFISAQLVNQILRRWDALLRMTWRLGANVILDGTIQAK